MIFLSKHAPVHNLFRFQFKLTECLRYYFKLHTLLQILMLDYEYTLGGAFMSYGPISSFLIFFFGTSEWLHPLSHYQFDTI